jgi:hypothetical protein
MAAEPKSLGADVKPVDPTANVIALVEANAKSADMLRQADIKFNDKIAEHLKEIGVLRADHAKQTREFDTAQAVNIRAVDMANAEKTAAQILQAVNTNAAVAERTALTLAKQVTDTAAAQENRQAPVAADMLRRLSAVELSMSKGEGKQAVADPALTKTLESISTVLQNLTANQDRGSGKSEGSSDTWKLIIVVAGLLLTFLAYQSSRQQPVQIVMPSSQPSITTTTPVPSNSLVPR